MTKRRKSRVVAGETRRRVPSQKRSLARAEMVLVAAADLMVRDGYAATTTSSIARYAKVSVGAIYQYFRNKEAIAAALRERLGRTELAAMSHALADASSSPIRESVERLVETYVAVRGEHGDLRKVLVEETPLVSGRDWIAYSDAHLLTTVETIVRNHPEVAVQDPRLASIAILTAVESIVNRVLLSPEPVCDKQQLQQSLSAWVVAALVSRDSAIF